MHAGFDFSSLPSGSTIIDVGGGVGAASLPILRANEHLRLVVQDTEEVVNVAPSVSPLSLFFSTDIRTGNTYMILRITFRVR